MQYFNFFIRAQCQIYLNVKDDEDITFMCQSPTFFVTKFSLEHSHVSSVLPPSYSYPVDSKIEKDTNIEDENYKMKQVQSFFYQTIAVSNITKSLMQQGKKP